MMNDKHDTIFDLVLSPDFDNDGLCFAARETGLYRSTDGGETWQDAFAALQTSDLLSALAVVFSPDFITDGTIYAGSLGVVFRSTDRGGEWTAVKLQSPLPLVSCMTAVPDGTLLVGTLDDGVFVSSNRGEGYTGWNYGLLDTHVYCLTAYADVIYAGVESGIFCSRNGGRLWEEVDFPMELAPVNTVVRLGTRLLAGTEEQGLYASLDGGKSWTRVAEAVFPGAVNELYISADGTLMAVTDEQILVSQDDGETWQERWRVSNGFGIAACAAGEYFTADSPLLVGLANGQIIRVG